MKVEVLVSTMNQKDYSLIDKMKIKTDAIVVNQCQEDNSQEFIKNGHRIKWINSSTRGFSISRNICLENATADICLIADDDLEYTKYEEMNSEGVETGVVVSGPKHITRTGMFNFCWPGCLTVMYDREYVGEIQIADIKKNNDYAMWLKVCRRADCYLLDEILAKYRRGRAGSVSSHSIKTMIGWHYKLFREAEGQNVVSAVFNTCRNLGFGFYKKRCTLIMI